MRRVIPYGKTADKARPTENSTTNRMLELTSVPLEVIPGDAVSRWERYGIPAGLGTLLALLFAAAAD
jgi:hypothetical protein